MRNIALEEVHPKIRLKLKENNGKTFKYTEKIYTAKIKLEGLT